jgi:polar amino acid transport system permease protein
MNYFISISDSSQKRIWYFMVAAAAIGAVWLGTLLDWNLLWLASPLLLQGLGITCLLTAISVAAGMVLGTLLALARSSHSWLLRIGSTFVTEIIRATPQLMVIFWVFFAYPSVTGHTISPWTGGTAALSLIAAAYLAEVIRGGLLTIPQVQIESAKLLGLSSFQINLYILLPQACRNMLPAFIATVIMMFKTTALVYVIGIIDFFKAVSIVNNREFAPLTMYTLMAVVYFTCCYALSCFLRFIDPKYKVVA